MPSSSLIEKMTITESFHIGKSFRFNLFAKSLLEQFQLFPSFDFRYKMLYLAKQKFKKLKKNILNKVNNATYLLFYVFAYIGCLINKYMFLKIS